VLYNQLMLNNSGRYTMNLEDLDKQLSQGAKMFIFCSPHNPVGRVWNKEELKELAAVLSKYEDVVILMTNSGQILFFLQRSLFTLKCSARASETHNHCNIS